MSPIEKEMARLKFALDQLEAQIALAQEGSEYEDYSTDPIVKNLVQERDELAEMYEALEMVLEEY